MKFSLPMTEAAAGRCSVKKDNVKNLAKFTVKQLCLSMSRNLGYNFIRKETSTQVFSCIVCEIFRNHCFCCCLK